MAYKRVSATAIDEIAEDIFRLSTPVSSGAGGFTFNQYLIVDDTPLLFHTGLRRHFEMTRDAIDAVIPLETLRYIAFSHFEADECGALNDLLSCAPRAVPLCSRVAALTSIQDVADRQPRALEDQELVELGKHRVRWLATPHLPHGWESGLLFDDRSRTLFCGDLFTQGGTDLPALTESDILAPSEALRLKMDYFAHTRGTVALIEHLAVQEPTTLACMHGSAWAGDGAALLRALGECLA